MHNDSIISDIGGYFVTTKMSNGKSKYFAANYVTINDFYKKAPHYYCGLGGDFEKGGKKVP